jgi:hypothetical protein
MRPMRCKRASGVTFAPERFVSCYTTKHGDEQKIRGPGRELNPGPPPDDSSPKKESYY